jgi:tetratricopeptide (TPR) repeat protein
MYKCILPAQHPDVAECLGNIGLVYENKRALSVALDYYHQQLEIEEACLPPDHPRLCQHANWIVDAYKKIDDIDTALKFCHKRLNAQKDALTENHPHVARTLVTTASILQDSNRKKAFEHYQEALSILQCTTIPDYQAISECLIAMGCLYSKCGMLDAALEAHLEAVNIYRQILPSDHVDLAHSLRNLGASYRDIDNISEAKQCFNDSLSIYQANYGPEDEYVKRGLTELANLSEKSSQR